MAASIRSKISTYLIMNYECKLTSRSSNIFPLMCPLHSFITGAVMVDGLNRHPLNRTQASRPYTAR